MCSLLVERYPRRWKKFDRAQLLAPKVYAVGKIGEAGEGGYQKPVRCEGTLIRFGS